MKDPERVFRRGTDLPGCRRGVTTMRPAESLAYDAADWAGVVVVVTHGRLRVECRSGAGVTFEEGAVLVLEGLALRRLTNPGLEPLVLTTLTRDSPRPPH